MLPNPSAAPVIVMGVGAACNHQNWYSAAEQPSPAFTPGRALLVIRDQGEIESTSHQSFIDRASKQGPNCNNPCCVLLRRGNNWDKGLASPRVIKNWSLMFGRWMVAKLVMCYILKALGLGQCLAESLCGLQINGSKKATGRP